MIAEDFKIFDLKAGEETSFEGYSLSNKEGIIQDKEGGVYFLEVTEDGIKAKRGVPKGKVVSFGGLLFDEKEGEVCECLGFYPLEETRAKIKHRGPHLEKYLKKFYTFGSDALKESRAIGVSSGLCCLEMLLKRNLLLGEVSRFQERSKVKCKEVLHSSTEEKESIGVFQKVFMGFFYREKNKFIETQKSIKTMADSGSSLKEIETHVEQSSKEDGIEGLIFVLVAWLFSISLSLEEIGVLLSLCVFPFPVAFYMAAICGSTIFLFMYEFEKTIN